MNTDYERENGGKLAAGFTLTIAANGTVVQKVPLKLPLARHFNLTGTQMFGNTTMPEFAN